MTQLRIGELYTRHSNKYSLFVLRDVLSPAKQHFVECTENKKINPRNRPKKTTHIHRINDMQPDAF